jgi:DNA-binding CsgD family transcriptional regulator
MLNQSNLLADYTHELYAVSSLEERFKIYEKYIQQLGFEGATYTFIPKIQLESTIPVHPFFEHTDSFSIDFLDHYTSEQLDQHDFTIRKTNNNELSPMDWRQHELRGLVSDNERGVIQLAREDYGINNALTIPTLGNEMGIAGATVISSEKDASFKKLKQERMEALVCYTRLFHDTSFSGSKMPLKFIEPFIESLKPTEIEILHCLASGIQFKNIEYHMDISSYKYASNILNNLRKRLGGITRDRLMYLVGSLDINNLLTWEADREQET